MSHLHTILRKLQRIPLYIRHYTSNEIVINGFFAFDEDGLTNSNFGDDFNFPLLHALTGRPVRDEYHVGLGIIENLLCIGSIIEFACNEKSIIWGSGLISETSDIRHSPQKVCAVRGPRTRKRLVQNGIECPEIYGDPALLMPYIYKPKTEKKYKVGIIPHYIDYDLPHVKEYREMHPEIKFIKFRAYDSWQQVIDDVCSCDVIISSSLHGLIVSDAYGIPNTRIVLSDNITGGDFKYMDYFEGIDRKYSEPIDCRESIDLNQILPSLAIYQPIQFDPKSLLQAFPYRLAKRFQELAK